jgi:hypothetical protein
MLDSIPVTDAVLDRPLSLARVMTAILPRPSYRPISSLLREFQ